MITKNEISSLNLSPTKKDFVQIWNELIEVASKITERWDPTSTNESDPGIVLLKVLAGIADKLNYNIDKNILEAFMPTAAQMESMRKLCELVGYDIKYYQSAETRVRIKYTGSTTEEEEKLPSTGLLVPKFTTITNADKDITFVTTNTTPVYITNDIPWVEVTCIEGQISQCESINENNLITLAQLDTEYRYYLPEIQIAENGIFVYNAAIASDGSYEDGVRWEQVSNLNTRSTETRVFKFGYDSSEGRPYLAFPEDIGSLISDGLFIYFIRTSGLNGNISPRTLEVLELPAGNGWDDYSAEQFEVTNENATTNGANIENISTAYNNFKKTVGTFDTLVTCRDYMNKIYSLMDASNYPYVSNILVTDIRNDINSAITLCSCNEFGILYKETSLTRTEEVTSTSTAPKISVVDIKDASGKTVAENQLTIHTEQPVIVEAEVPLIDHFDLVLYPFKTFTQVSSGTKDLVTAYNKSFTYSELMNREIAAAVDEFKTCAHNFVTPIEGSLVAINNYLRLNALIATSNKVSELEANAILQNVKVALVNEFNMRNLDFGEEIPFDSILSVIENADSRIKVVSLQEPTVLTTYSVKVPTDSGATSKEYGILSTASDVKIDGVTYTTKTKDEDTGEETEKVDETAKEIYNKLVIRNILAGRASLLDYDETFIPNNSEKPYTVTKEITANIEASSDIANAISAIIATDPASGEHLLKDSDGKLITEGVYSSESVLTLKVFDEDITKKLEDINKDSSYSEYEQAKASSIIAAVNRNDAVKAIEDATATAITARTAKAAADKAVIEAEAALTAAKKTATLKEYNRLAAALEAAQKAAIEASIAEEVADQTATRTIENNLGKYTLVAEGFFNGTEVTLTISKDPNTKEILYIVQEEKVYKVYETYEPNFKIDSSNNPNATPAVATFARTANSQVQSNIINNISRVEAICEINSNINDVDSEGQSVGLFEDIKLEKNEVIKFRAPNLITTKTFPAYVYYHFEKATRTTNGGTSGASGQGTKSGSYAECKDLRSFITKVGIETFLDELLRLAAGTNNVMTFTALIPTSTIFDQRDKIAEVFNTAMAIRRSKYTQVGEAEIKKIYVESGTLIEDLQSHFTAGGGEVEFEYCPLNVGTLASVWETAVKNCDKGLPSDQPALWKLSSTSSYPMGRLVLNNGRKLFAPNGDFLMNCVVGSDIYVCTNQGSDPEYYTLSTNSDVELQKGDKLYIHYTPSSTNEDGETVSAEPVSVIYTSTAKDPVILKPSGFTLIPTVDVLSQGTSPKKYVTFPGESEPKGLLALAPNEQIELRSISKVVLDRPARFYKNFDNAQLETGDINNTVSYELKDGEYIFYTDQNNQEAAYYGSGSVITLSPGAYIPKASEQVEVSQILEQGLHIVPWSSFVLLDKDRNKTVTVTEYQYVTLVEGDTLNILQAGDGKPLTKSEWLKCNQTNYPITYTPSGAETAITLPKIQLGQGSNIGWEVCSLLELSTSPGYAQQLRAVGMPKSPTGGDAPASVVRKINNKINVYTKTLAGEQLAYSIEPEETTLLGNNTSDSTASAIFEPVSIKLSTIAQAASGNLEPTLEDDTPSIQMKVFKEEAPSKIELLESNDIITPISDKPSASAETSSDNINNYLTKVDIGELWRTVTEVETKKDENNDPVIVDGKEVKIQVQKNRPNALKLNFMIPKDADIFGIFSVYVETPIDKLDSTSKQNMLKGPYTNDLGEEILGSRIFIDIPEEFGSYKDVIVIYNNDGDWWSEGIAVDNEGNSMNRLYLRAGLNCIKIIKPCSILIKAEENASGSILYDNMRLVKGIQTNGINLKLLDPNTTFNTEAARIAETEAKIAELQTKISIIEAKPDDKRTEQEKNNLAIFNAEVVGFTAEVETFKEIKQELANKVLSKIKELDKNHDFYYNVLIENSLAIEFDDNINSFSSPYTLYDINNVNNSFVISKLDVAYLDNGLSIAKSSRY